MGDKGGKKDKEKAQKQTNQKHKQNDKKKADKQPVKKAWSPPVITWRMIFSSSLLQRKWTDP